MRRLSTLLCLLELSAWVQGGAYLPAAYEKACDGGVLDFFGEQPGSEEEAAMFPTMRERRSFYPNRNCNCGPGTKYCVQHHGIKKCQCRNDALVIDVSCGDCPCPNGICDGTSKCHCKKGYGLKAENTCEECNCGDDMPCKFVEGMKLCLCYEKFISANRGCKGCNCDSNELCFDNHEMRRCECVHDESGTNPPQCTSYGYGELGCECPVGHNFCFHSVFVTKCKCLPHHVKINGTCTPIDCKCEDENAVCDLQDDGTKVCSCKDRFVENNGTCVECFCGEGHSCELKNGSTACICQEGHIEHDGICKQCICGEDEDCELVDGNMICSCKENYIRVDGVCRECFCGEGHGCDYFDGMGKLCTCRKYFAEIGGTCKECHCGGGHVCEFIDGNKMCLCSPGFSEKNGICEECFCGNDSDCSFDGEDKVCMCNNGSIFKNEMCLEICRNDTCDRGTCEIEDDTFKCSCDIGFGGDRCDQKLAGSKETIVGSSCRNDSCDRGTCEIKDGTFKCSCDIGFGGDRCEKKLAVSKEASFVIYTLIVVTLVWIVLVAVYFIRKKRKRDPSYQKVSEGGAPNDGVFMSTIASSCDR